ncbi:MULTISPECIES: hypothetical protein [unclassified Microcoleus]|uniref:hypothetical protein n=1 Tax=unclassified Microcoleus TaxID=2642155 RepID=UPI002FD1C8B3
MKAPKVGIEGRRQDPVGKAQKEGVRTSVFTNMRCSPNDYLLLTRTRWGVQTLLLGLGHRETFRYTIAGNDALVLRHLSSNYCI